MVAYSFQPRFVEPIRQGLKTQTIRMKGLKPHVRPGQMMQLYTGMRTPQCRRILPDVTCLEVMPIRIGFETGEIRNVWTDGIPVMDLDAFAIRDGFADAVDMWAFWCDHYPAAVAEGGFHGVVIEWARPAETEVAVAA